MRYVLIIILFLWQCPLLFAQQGKRYIKKGNELYQQQKYKEAEASYRQSFGKVNPPLEGQFNLGDALYKQKNFPQAVEQFNQIASSPGSSKAVKAQAYHNLGNSFVENKKLEEGIAAYKKSLINNPKDDETRYNLAYAQEMLKKQQQQNKDKNKDQKNKDQKDKDQKDKDKNKDQNKKDENKKDQDKQNQDKKDQKDGQKPQPDKLSKEDAQRMLDALNNNEKETQDKLKNKKLKGEKVRISKDW